MSYVPVLLLLAVGILVGSVILALTSLAGGTPNRRKDMPFECGVPQYQAPHHRLPVRYYVVALLFLLFDIESVFFYPFAVTFRKFLASGNAIFWEMGSFTLIVVVGYIYVLGKGALEWE